MLGGSNKSAARRWLQMARMSGKVLCSWELRCVRIRGFVSGQMFLDIEHQLTAICMMECYNDLLKCLFRQSFAIWHHKISISERREIGLFRCIFVCGSKPFLNAIYCECTAKSWIKSPCRANAIDCFIFSGIQKQERVKKCKLIFLFRWSCPKWPFDLNLSPHH